jgi:hypothetical protein
MTFWDWQNYGDSEKIRGCQECVSGVGEEEKLECRGFVRQCEGFCVILWCWIHVIPVPKPIQCTTPRVRPDLDYVLWVIMVCQHRFIDCKEYVSNGGAMPRCGGLSWESKTALKVRCWWLMPVSLASQEAEIRRVTVWGHLGKILCETPSQKYSTQKKGWWSDPSCRVPASVRPWIQTPVPPKEKKVTFLNKP